MEIRQATVQDVPAIIPLLKESLGESLMPKSEHYWRWKHIENPFGSSPVLLATEGSEIIGVRAFMRWRWSDGSQRFSAVRAVDTATHPRHQGKGIFKKLTLALVDQCTRNGDHFVFNTPNSQSSPGYLKMGWITAGKLPVRLSATRAVSMVRRYLSKENISIDRSEDNSEVVRILGHAGLKSLLGAYENSVTGMHTAYSPEYLHWRYGTVPVASYKAFAETKGNDLTGLVIGRIKESRMGRELRITDCFISDASAVKGLRQQILEAVKSLSVDYITFAGTKGHDVIAKIIPGLGSFLPFSIGPIVTVRSLQLTDLSRFVNFENWSPSFGDLELF